MCPGHFYGHVSMDTGPAANRGETVTLADHPNEKFATGSTLSVNACCSRGYRSWMCNLYSLTLRREHVGPFFRVGQNRMPAYEPQNAISPNYNAPAVRTMDAALSLFETLPRAWWRIATILHR